MELLRDSHGLGGGHRTVGAARGVVQFAVGSVAGAGVVPGVRGLLAGLVQLLKERDLPLGLQLLQEGTQGSGHNAAANENDIETLRWTSRR